MEKFRLIGLWLGDGAPDWPAVEDFVFLDADRADREELAQLLERGTRTDRAYMGWSICRICGCTNGSGELTDGVLIWPEGLAHYIREHHVVLPEDVETLLRATARVHKASIKAAVEAANEERDAEWWRSFRRRR